jgi:hypothetical protein
MAESHLEVEMSCSCMSHALQEKFITMLKGLRIHSEMCKMYKSAH